MELRGASGAGDPTATRPRRRGRADPASSNEAKELLRGPHPDAARQSSGIAWDAHTFSSSRTPCEQRVSRGECLHTSYLSGAAYGRGCLWIPTADACVDLSEYSKTDAPSLMPSAMPSGMPSGMPSSRPSEYDLEVRSTHACAPNYDADDERNVKEVVRYDYDLVLTNDDDGDDSASNMTSILRELESNLLDYVGAALDEAGLCAGGAVAAGEPVRRSLGSSAAVLEGISSSPSDEVLEDAACSEDRASSSESICQPVAGYMTIVYKYDAPPASSTLASSGLERRGDDVPSQVLSIVRRAVKSDAMLWRQYSPSVQGVYFVETRGDYVELNHHAASNPYQNFEDQPSSGSFRTGAIAGVVLAALAVFVTSMYISRRFGQRSACGKSKGTCSTIDAYSMDDGVIVSRHRGEVPHAGEESQGDEEEGIEVATVDEFECELSLDGSRGRKGKRAKVPRIQGRITDTWARTSSSGRGRRGRGFEARDPVGAGRGGADRFYDNGSEDRDDAVSTVRRRTLRPSSKIALAWRRVKPGALGQRNQSAPAELHASVRDEDGLKMWNTVPQIITEEIFEQMANFQEKMEGGAPPPAEAVDGSVLSKSLASFWGSDSSGSLSSIPESGFNKFLREMHSGRGDFLRRGA